MSTVCACGCQKPALPGSKYAQNTGKGNCRDRVFALYHPRLDLSGLDPVAAKRAARMVAEAVKAAKLGQSRATVDASKEVKHKAEARPDSRPSCRVRLSAEAWEMLSALAGRDHGSRSQVAEALIRIAYVQRRWTT